MGTEPASPAPSPSTVPERVIALDTQVLLHFKHLNELRPEDFGIPSPAKWLITATVEREIQLKKNADRLQRRARQVDKLLDDQTLPIRRFRPASPVDYPKYNLDPNHSDERILSELIAFREENPHVDLRFVSDDGGLRRNAKDLGFTVIAPDDKLRDRPDPVALENADLRKELTALKTARPNLEIMTDPRPCVAQVGEALDDQRLQDAVEKQVGFVAPDPESVLCELANSTMFALMSGEPNPKYAEQRLEYIEAFRAYYRDLYRVKRRLVTIGLHLMNSGDVPAEGVDVDLWVPEHLGDVYGEPPAEPELPNPPKSHKERFSTWRLLAQQQNFYGGLNATALRRLIDTPPPVDYGPSVVRDGAGDVQVRFHRAKIKQRSGKALPEFYIVLSDDVRGGFQLRYEVRSKAPGVMSGTIDVRCTIGGGEPPPVPIRGKDDSEDE